jgi:hypothetical protein
VIDLTVLWTVFGGVRVVRGVRHHFPPIRTDGCVSREHTT